MGYVISQGSATGNTTAKPSRMSPAMSHREGLMKITEGGLDDPRVVELLKLHITRARAETAPGSAHALDLSGLKATGVRFWTAWVDGESVGCGALDRKSTRLNSSHRIRSRMPSSA